MKDKTIKLDDGDLINLKYIVNGIKVSSIRNYKEISLLLYNFNRGAISREEYNAGYENVVMEAKNTLNNFKRNFSELYICNIISKRNKSEDIKLSENVYFNGIVNSLNLYLKYNLAIPQIIIKTIAKFDTNEIMNNTAKLNFKLKLHNSDSISNQAFIDAMNNKFNELKHKKTLVKK